MQSEFKGNKWILMTKFTKKVNELIFKIKMIEEKVKEKSKNIEKRVKDMQNRLKIVKKI